MELKSQIEGFKDVFVVYDRNVAGYVRELLPGFPALAIDACEAAKTLDTVAGICRWLLENGADREALVLAVGGGVTTDTVGFAASIFKRGVRYANVPTTLLSQVDASIGGKTGVNLDGFKNMLGVFAQPQFTFPLPEALKTLPEREFRSGAAEMLKTFIISDGGNYAKAVTALSRAEKDYFEIGELVRAAAAVKSGIVSRDPLEKGERRVLNLGHTMGHAIEWRSPGVYTHGEAVAMGIVYAARLAERCGVADSGLAERLAADFISCGLPVELPFPEEELMKAAAFDKKVSGGRINWILPVRIGEVRIIALD